MDLTILLFAMVAAVLIFRLRSVLGRRTGHERPPETARRSRPADAQDDKVVSLPERRADEAMQGSPLDAAIAQIQVADRGFDPEEFLVGARVAFEMIVGAFAHGDKSALRPLLSDEVYENFANAVDAREQRKEQLETTLVSIREATIVDARLDGRTALVTVRFVSEQINVTRNADGAVVDGDPDHVTRISDVWTFGRNTRSRDPNWALVETSLEN